MTVKGNSPAANYGVENSRDVFGEFAQRDEPDVRNTQTHVGDPGPRYLDGLEAMRRDDARKQGIRRAGKDRGAPRHKQSLEPSGSPLRGH